MTNTPENELAAGLPPELELPDAYAEGADDGSETGLTDEEIAAILNPPAPEPAAEPIEGPAPDPAPETPAPEPAADLKGVAEAPKRRGRPRKSAEPAPEAAEVKEEPVAETEVLEGLVVGVDLPASTLLEMEVGRRALAAKAG